MARRRTESIRYATQRGWDYVVRPGGHLCFMKGGHKVFTPVSPSDRRGRLNFEADIRRHDREIEQQSRSLDVRR
jgi:hypothetical protein